ncbi:MAG: hypothetical protein P0S95_08275, partial [Rhabdochlamydiaceae bacterium]|nr:hypothetical protein [Candidatus Amphrikana amoebophyrae]
VAKAPMIRSFCCSPLRGGFRFTSSVLVTKAPMIRSFCCSPLRGGFRFTSSVLVAKAPNKHLSNL